MEKLCWCDSGLPYAQCHEQSDRMLGALRARGERVPDKHLVKNSVQIEGIRRAGRINALVLDAVEAAIRPGMTTQEIDDLVSERTKQLGGLPAQLGYYGFPKSVCTSVNNVICHGIPSKDTVLVPGDIINVDCTTVVDGYYGDASRMFCIGTPAPNARKLVQTTREAVALAVSHLHPYCHLGDIGYYISQHAAKNGYSVVRNIGGHGCGLEMHEDPFVCHIGQLNKGLVLVPGMVFTIEPMINEGSARFCIEDGWQVLTQDGKLSAQVEHMVLITNDGYEILSA